MLSKIYNSPLIPKQLRKLLSKKKRRFLELITNSFSQIVFKSRYENYKDIPIVINNRNHFTYLKKLIEFLESNNYSNIIILDNQSTYGPLLSYYRKIKHRIFYLDSNLGPTALNKCKLFQELKDDYFVYSDADVLPIKECPHDFVNHFLQILKKDLTVQKVGFSLKIDDLPDHYQRKSEVIKWEKQFWMNDIGNMFEAQIDTTFALHRPKIKTGLLSKYVKHVRTKYPYQARHLPWYEDSSIVSQESKFYYENARFWNTW